MRHHLLIFLYAALLLLPLLDNGTVLTRHEVLAAEPAREMIETGASWVVQTFAGQFRTAKPPTMSWMIAACMTVFDSRSEFVARLPAALAGIITCHAIAVIASRLLRDPRAGLLAGLCTATTFWVQMQARLAEADMPLTAAVTLAMMALVLLHLPTGEGRGEGALQRQGAPASESPLTLTLSRRARGLSLLFYCATGFGFMLKGVAPLVTIPAAITLALWTRDRRIRRLLLDPFGIAVFIVLLIVWPVAAYFTYPNIVTDWRAQTVDRWTGNLEGDRDSVTLVTYVRDLPMYVWWVPVLLLPATPAAILGLYNAFDRWRTSRVAKFLIAWVAPFFILITLSAWKHKHYALPILPAFSVLAAYGTLLWMRSLKRPHVATSLLVTWFVGCAVVLLAYQWKIHPKFDVYQRQAELALKANQLLPADQKVALVGLGEAQVAYYLRNVPYRIDDVSTLKGDHVAIAARRTMDELAASHRVEELSSAAPRDPKKPEEALVLFRIGS